MNVDLNLNITLNLVGLAPLKLDGCCGDTHFIIMEDEGGFLLTGSDGLEQRYLTLKHALQDCYLNWG